MIDIHTTNVSLKILYQACSEKCHKCATFINEGGTKSSCKISEKKKIKNCYDATSDSIRMSRLLKKIPRERGKCLCGSEYVKKLGIY